MKIVAKVLAGLLGTGAVFTLVAGLLAWDPSELETIVRASPEKIAVKLAEPPQAEELTPPPESSASLMRELAPESFAPADVGAGIGFGNQGNGPALGGQGGFEGDTSQLVRQAGTVSRPPRLLFKSPPDYPSEARGRGIAGFVTLRIRIAISGAIESVEVQQSEPVGFFDQAALQAVKRWRFEPALENGRAVAAWTQQKIKFDLN